MRKVVPSFLIAMVAIVGCDVQHGQFVTTGSMANAIRPGIGSVDIVRGYPNKFNSEDGDEQNLLYAVILCRAVPANGESSSEDYGTYETTLSHAWNTGTGTISVAIRWDRRDDTVSVGKQVFARSAGNVFIVHCDHDSESNCQQLPNLGKHVSFQGVIDYVRKQLPNDQTISSMSLMK